MRLLVVILASLSAAAAGLQPQSPVTTRPIARSPQHQRTSIGGFPKRRRAPATIRQRQVLPSLLESTDAADSQVATAAELKRQEEDRRRAAAAAEATGYEAGLELEELPRPWVLGDLPRPLTTTTTQQQQHPQSTSHTLSQHPFLPPLPPHQSRPQPPNLSLPHLPSRTLPPSLTLPPLPPKSHPHAPPHSKPKTPTPAINEDKHFTGPKRYHPPTFTSFPDVFPSNPRDQDGKGIAVHPGGATSYVFPTMHGVGKREVKITDHQHNQHHFSKTPHATATSTSSRLPPHHPFNHLHYYNHPSRYYPPYHHSYFYRPYPYHPYHYPHRNYVYHHQLHKRSPLPAYKSSTGYHEYGYSW